VGKSQRGCRKARVRNEYAAWYPTLGCNVWMTASMVARKVALQLAGRGSVLEPHWALGSRLLDDRHFIFRGGLEPRASSLRTRREDVQTSVLGAFPDVE